MNLIDEYKEKAVMGFNGCHFFEGKYMGKTYLTIRLDKYCLLSKDKICEATEFDDDQYVTELNLSQMEDYFQSKLYATYKGNEYEVQNVNQGFTKLQLLARKGHENEDIELGFEESMQDAYTKEIYRFINIEEIDSIRVERVSVYKDFLKK